MFTRSEAEQLTAALQVLIEGRVWEALNTCPYAGWERTCSATSSTHPA